ncbi:MAG: transposase [Clostridium perfringens]|nr:transposase [Clostridium perfringens]
MKKLKRAYKIEINPTDDQKSKIHQTIGVSRFIYNFYIAHNKEIYEKEGKFVSGMDFSKWLNNEYIPNNQDKKWIKEVSSKATKQAIMNGDKAFKDFFKKAKDFPRFKKKKNQDVKAYFPKNNKTDWTLERHRVKIPTLGWVRLKEFGYIPKNSVVKSGTVISRKYESLKIRNKNIKEGRATRQNIQKQVVKVQRLHQRLANIRTDYINKTVFSIVKQKPSYITIEDLAVSNMMKNKHLSKAISSQKFFEFKTKLMSKCKQNNIELRIVDRFYPSSKTCSNCGKIKKDLKLSDRIYKCDCGFTIDRDLNASINLKNAKEYKIA